MIKYSISIENDLLTTPYVYNVNLQSINTELSEDININFVVINKENTGGIIIENNSGDSLSGDYIEDNTTLGDLNNSVNNIGNKIENLGNSIENTILGEVNESGDRQGGLLGGLLDGIVGLFIPSAEDMTEWLSRTQNEVSERLDILGEPINFFNSLMTKLMVGSSGDFIIDIPELSIPNTFEDNKDFVIYKGCSINFNKMMEDYPVFKMIYDTYIVMISGIMVYAFFSYLWSFLDFLMGSRSVESSFQIVEKEVEHQRLVNKERNRQPIGFRVKGDNRK